MEDERRARLVDLAQRLPEVVVAGEQHLAVQVRGRTVAYYLDDHHGDEVVGLCCKAAPGEQQALTAADPARFFRPSYLSRHGWVGVRLDLPAVDRDEVAELLVGSYRLVAPKRLVAILDAGGSTPPVRP